MRGMLKSSFGANDLPAGEAGIYFKAHVYRAPAEPASILERAFTARGEAGIYFKARLPRAHICVHKKLVIGQG